jgi:integrase
MAGRRSSFGYIRKLPSGRYQASYRHGGTRHYGPHAFKWKSEADDFLAEVQTKIRRNEWIDPDEGKVLFRDYAEKWRANQVHRRSTATQVESHLRNHVNPKIGDRTMVSIRSSDIQALVKQLSEGSKDQKPLSPATVEVIYTWVSTIFSAAVGDRVIPATPCIKIKRPEIVRRRIDPVSVETVWKLINGVPDRYRALIALGAGTGVRISEALGLTNDRVDWLRRTVTIDRQLMRVLDGSSPVFGKVKDKSNRPRAIPLPDFVVKELSTHISRFGLGPQGLIFTGPRGGPIRRATFSDVWRVAAEPLGFDTGEGFHQLRHFYASLLIESGQSVRTIQDRLGHHSAAITLDVYGHLWPEGEDATRAAVDKAFEGHIAPESHVSGQPPS